MSTSKQLVIGIFIGVLIGTAVFYAFAQFSQISNLQNQISDLQSQNSQLQSENSQLKSNNTALLSQIGLLQSSGNNTVIVNLLSQISQLQNENSQLKANNTILANQIQQLQNGSYKFEKLEFISVYANGDETAGFTVHMQLKNTGSATATIDDSLVLLNAKPASSVSATVSIAPLTLPSGSSTSSATVTGLTKANGFSRGMTLEITIQTIAGNQCSKVITLP